MSKHIDGVGEVATPTTFKEKISNFLYHYKWHTVVALAVVIAIVICSLQFCSKASYDAHILYIGSKNIGRVAKDGDVPEIVELTSALKLITDDFDGNGSVTIGFTNYYHLSEDEKKQLDDVNETLLNTDMNAIPNVLMHSDYYLSFISVSAYEKYHKVGDEVRFISLTSFASGEDVDFYSDYAIYLSSTGAYQIPGLSLLPEDTLICIRCPSSLGGMTNEHSQYVENAKKMLTNILSYS